MINVLFITDPGIVGGATRALVELTTEIKKLGINPIVCTSNINKLNEELNRYGIKSVAIGHRSVMEPISPYIWKRPIKKILWKVLYYWAIFRAIKVAKNNEVFKTIDLIHTNSARNDIGIFISRIYEKPHIMHFREFGEEDFKCITYRRKYTTFLNKNVEQFIAVSSAVKESWIKKGVLASKIKIIYDGVYNLDIDQKSKDSYNNKKLNLVIVGGVCEAKGQHIAIEALSYLPNSILNNIHLDIIGWKDERYYNGLLHIIHKNKLSPYITFTGAKSNVHQLLKNYDIGIMCSRSEGFGRVTVEYMDAGLGVIATNSGANPELIQNELSGLLFEKDNAIMLANCIKRFYENRKLLKQCAQLGRQYASESFSAELNASNIYLLYNEVIAKYKNY